MIFKKENFTPEDTAYLIELYKKTRRLDVAYEERAKIIHDTLLLNEIR
jgi:hypothetical protein